MPSKGDTQINNFVGGLITEASPLSFPPNASFDEINFKLNRDGTRERRLGLDIEDGGTEFDVSLTAAQLQRARHTFFDWPSPSGSDLVHIGVIQSGNKLFFINLLNQSPSSELLNNGNAITLDLDVDIQLTFTLHNNELIAVSEEFFTILFISYDEGTDTITTTDRPLMIRDFYGVDDTLGDETRPSTLSDAHQYNLKNQGWGDEIQTVCTISGVGAIQCTQEKLGIYPSNADQWSLGKIEDATDANIDRYDPETLRRNAVNLGSAAKGHFIISPYSRGFYRNTLSVLDSLPIDRELGRVSTLTSYAGRIFYSGVRSRVSNGDIKSPLYGGVIFFSQLATSTEKATQCYQVADPTSAEDNAIADTDGGVIQITEAIGIVKLLTIKDSLFVFARNGIWQIKGDGGGFKATAFQVKKISAAGTVSAHSVVDANGTIIYWGEGGIFSLVLDNLGENYETKNITQPTIQKYFNSLPDLTKQTAKGIYDMKENQVRWLFKSDFPKIVGDPIDIHPIVPIIGIGAPTALSSGVEPKVVKTSHLACMVIFRNTAATAIGARLLTADESTLTVSTGVEQTLVTGAAIQGLNLLKLTDDRMLMTWQEGTIVKGVVLHVISGSIFLSATATIDSNASVVGFSAPIRTEVISGDSTVLISYLTIGAKTGVRVLSIDSSFVITAGTLDEGSSTSVVRTDAVLLDSTNGVMLSDVGSRSVLETFTISGTTVTASGVANTFMNTLQITPPTGHVTGKTSLAKGSSTTVFVSQVLTTSNPTVSSEMAHFLGIVSGTTITSEDLLEQTLEIGTVPFSKTIEGKAVTVYRKPAGGALRGRVLVNTLATPPQEEFQLDVGTDTTFNNPEFDSVDGGLLVIAYEDDTTTISAIAARVVI